MKKRARNLLVGDVIIFKKEFHEVVYIMVTRYDENGMSYTNQLDKITNKDTILLYTRKVNKNQFSDCLLFTPNKLVEISTTAKVLYGT